MNDAQQLLIQKRSPTKDLYPNVWDISVAGHVDAGQTSLETAVREIQEEIGVTVQPEQLHFLGSMHQEISQKQGGSDILHREIQDVFLITLNLDPSSLTLQPEEVTEIKYISPSALKEAVSTPSETYAAHPKEYETLFAHLAELALPRT